MGLYIGRFQPFHNGHLWAINKALEFCKKLIVCIGSAGEYGTDENPLNSHDREKILDSVLDISGLSDKCIVKSLDDINDNLRWVEHVKKNLGKFDIVISGDDINSQLFKDKGIEVYTLPRWEGINATEIRALIRSEGDWQESVPSVVSSVLKKKYLKKIIESENVELE